MIMALQNAKILLGPVDSPVSTVSIENLNEGTDLRN